MPDQSYKWQRALWLTYCQSARRNEPDDVDLLKMWQGKLADLRKRRGPI